MLTRILYMADPAPGGATPPPAVSEAGSSGMVDGIMAELTGTPPPADTPPPAEPAKPDAAPPPAAPTKPAAPPPAKPAPVTPPAKPAPTAAKTAAAAPPPDKPLDWKTAPAAFRTAHEKLLAVHQEQTAALQTKLTTTERRMQELEQREYLTPEQKQQYARLQERQQQLEADLYARDYRESPEFKAKYEDKAKKVWGNIQAELKGLQVNEAGATRAATVTDVQRLQAESASLSAQRRLAKEMFGEDADVVLKYIGELKAIEEAANDEIESKRTGWSKERETQTQTQQREMEASKRVYSEFDQTLAQKYFQPVADNPDYNKALEEGLKFVDGITGNFGKGTPEQRAQNTALVRRLAAHWPAQAVMLKQKDARIAELEASLARLQGTDPGAGGDGGGGTPLAENGSGTDSMVAEIEKLQNG